MNPIYVQLLNTIDIVILVLIFPIVIIIEITMLLWKNVMIDVTFVVARVII